jgi:hypothetical protein
VSPVLGVQHVHVVLVMRLPPLHVGGVERVERVERVPVVHRVQMVRVMRRTCRRGSGRSSHRRRQALATFQSFEQRHGSGWNFRFHAVDFRITMERGLLLSPKWPIGAAWDASRRSRSTAQILRWLAYL